MENVTIEALSEMTDAELDERLRALELERRAVEAEIAMTVAFADARQVGRHDGHRSTRAYLKATCNWSGGEASRIRSLARLVDRFPAVHDAWRSGRIGKPQAERLARLAGNRRLHEVLPEFVPLLVDYAEQLSFHDFDQVADRFASLADPDGAFDEEREGVEGRWAKVTNVGTSVDIRAEGGSAMLTDALIEVFTQQVEAEFRRDVEARKERFGPDADDHPLPRSGSQRSFDALCSLVLGSAVAANQRGAPDAPDAPVAPSPNPIVESLAGEAGLEAIGQLPAGFDLDIDIVVDEQSYAEGMWRLALVDDPTEVFGRRRTALIDRRCETSNGVPLRPEQAVAASLIGRVRRVVYGRGGVTINLGDRSRLYTGSAREAAKVLRQSCQHLGCDVPAHSCQVDHSVEWTDGGLTDQENARVRCGSHNRFKHRAELRDRRDVDGRLFTVRADGTVMQPVGQRPPVFPDEDDPDAAVGAPIPVIHLHLVETA